MPRECQGLSEFACSKYKTEFHPKLVGDYPNSGYLNKSLSTISLGSHIIPHRLPTQSKELAYTTHLRDETELSNGVVAPRSMAGNPIKVRMPVRGFRVRDTPVQLASLYSTQLDAA